VYRAAVPIALDHVLAVVLAVLFPLRAAWFGYRRLVDAEPADVPRVRLWLYRQGIAIQWALTAGAVALWIWRGRPWLALGLVPRWNYGLLGVAIGLAIAGGFILAQRRQILSDDEALERLRGRMRHIERLMPRTDQESRWFGGLSLTAGFCEELLYRGYLIWYLTRMMALVPALLVAGVVFGAGHSYQGPKGIAVTTMVGLFMSAVYVVTGSLFASMVIHALMDLYAGHMARAAFEREPVATVTVAEEAPVPAAEAPPSP
jgi:CAAX protease family protein